MGTVEMTTFPAEKPTRDEKEIRERLRKQGFPEKVIEDYLALTPVPEDATLLTAPESTTTSYDHDADVMHLGHPVSIGTPEQAIDEYQVGS
ncbi:hypothetical protein PENTCL1PPCAC_12410 [Pristionchus entomophagus]|uniref:LEM domain-containing protein n=1 Tax=Pristionchus entomophagus TaxID=358040 RepID=A0AAV5T561_9BILA|nr:hypothetical protein PENTCL1PPCAC_12410 [Pristionchus entomophagus]